MNLLLITQKVPGADFIKRELAKEMPGVHVEVSPDVQDATQRLAVPGLYSAVLLDSGLHKGDPLAVVKALRAVDRAIAVIGLIEPADLDSGINVMGAGADDCVVKRPGFVATLPAVLRRACGRHGVIRKLEPKAAPVRRNTAGATCVLLRNIVDIDSSLNRASEIDKDEERGSGKEPDADFPRREPEIRELGIQENPPSGVISASGGNPMHVEEESSTARSRRENELRDLNQRLQSAEEQRAILEYSLREATANSQMADQFRAEARAVKDQLGELEFKCRSLEENLRSAETSLAEQANVLQYEREQRSLETEELRTQLSLLEEQHRTLESALFSEKERQKKSDERHVAELQRWRSQQDELERRQRAFVEERSRMQKALQDQENQLADRTEELRVGGEQWDLRRTAWNRGLQTLEESCAKIGQEVLLQHAQQEEMAARFRADLSKSESARRELEQELRRADEECARLRESLRAAEARIDEQAEQLHTKREQRESKPLMSEQQRDALETRAVQLETAGDQMAKEHSVILAQAVAQAEKTHLEMKDRATAPVDELRLSMGEHSHANVREESERIQRKSARDEFEQQKTMLEEEVRLARQSLQKLKEEEANRLRWKAR